MTTGLWRAAVLAFLLALFAGCGGGGGGGDAVGGSKGELPSFQDDTTMARLQRAGKIRVGTKFDQPLFGLKTPGGDVEGFDVEIARLMAEGIFGKGNTDGRIEFVETPSRVRESSIVDDKVDIVVATYTITEERKQQVSFAGPYYVAGQDIMVKSDNTDIKSVEDLNGRRACTAEGSTSLRNLQQRAPQAQVLTFPTYSECAAALSDGRVEALTTDNVILLGLVERSGGAFKLVGNPFTEEPYGIGLKKDDTAFRDFLNERLAEIFNNGEWEAAYERTVGKVAGPAPDPPPLQSS
ncbi:MAG: glutamate ABC transporter substrate-binding protein [Actinomycetota bacterium]|nr:glutamate ABC transporter substrate-binding protein [Actinomycetota bacterium]